METPINILKHKIVRIRCNKCQRDMEPQQPGQGCPFCGEKNNLTFIYDNGQELNLGIKKPKYPPIVYAATLVSTIILFAAYKLLPFNLVAFVFVAVVAFDLIIAYKYKK